MLPKGLSAQRDIYRDKLKKLSLKDFIDVVAVRLLNNIDVATRDDRDQESSTTTVAVELSTELNYDDLKKINNAIKYLSGTLLLADIMAIKDVNESIDGPFTVVTTSIVVRHLESGKKLANADLVQIRTLLKQYRQRIATAA